MYLICIQCILYLYIYISQFLTRGWCLYELAVRKSAGKESLMLGDLSLAS